jgi:hypothetical protein
MRRATWRSDALEAADVEFIEENGGGAGARLRERARKKADA